MAFLLLGIGYLEADAVGPKSSCIKAGGVFGLLAAFLAWYNALAGILDDSNRYMHRPPLSFYIVISPSIQQCYSMSHSLKASILTASLKQLLRYSRRPFPLVRHGTREAQEDRACDCLRYLFLLKSYHLPLNNLIEKHGLSFLFTKLPTKVWKM